jgi:hypothetical protein
MRARIPTVLPDFVLAGTASSYGQDQPPSVDVAGPIATDRAAVTNSSVEVPAGSLLRRGTGHTRRSKRYFGLRRRAGTRPRRPLSDDLTTTAIPGRQAGLAPREIERRLPSFARVVERARTCAE